MPKGRQVLSATFRYGGDKSDGSGHDATDHQLVQIPVVQRSDRTDQSDKAGFPTSDHSLLC